MRGARDAEAGARRTAGGPAPPAKRSSLLLRSLVFLLAVGMLVLSATAAQAASLDDEELLFLRYVNEHRRSNGLPLLLLSENLSLTAERHATDMGKYRFFSHISERSDWYPLGSAFWERLERDGYRAEGTGENLAAGMVSADLAFLGWRDSPSHNEIMLDPDGVSFREIGIARVQVSGSPYTWYWATEFGTSVDSSAGDPFSGGGAGPFRDVPANDPYAAAVTKLSEAGVISGFDDGSFGPGKPVLRQQFAKMIVGALGLPVSEADVSPFEDVPQSGPASLYPDNYVAVAAAQGFTRGTGPDTFSPRAHISRAQVISMIVRAAQQSGAGLLTPPAGFAGGWGDFSEAHQENARIAQFNGLLSGLPVAALKPGAPMPRGEVAQVLGNLQQRLGK